MEVFGDLSFSFQRPGSSATVYTNVEYYIFGSRLFFAS